MKSEVTTLEELLKTNRTPGERDAADRTTRKAIITGGDTGIGRYAALALAEDGCDVAFTYAHHEEDAKLTAEGIRHFGRRAYFTKMDLTDPLAANQAIDQLVGQLGGLDIFVSNAGKMTMKRFPHLELKDLQDLFNVNCFGAVVATQRATRHLLGLSPDGNESTIDEIAHTARKVLTGKETSPRKTPGRIIVVTSVHEHVASPMDTTYTMTKHALGGFIKCAAFALAGTNVTVNGVRPGEIATPMNDMGPEEAFENDRRFIPSKRTGHPTEIASIIRYLASDDTNFINGVSYDVGGGMSIGEPMAQEMYQKTM